MTFVDYIAQLGGFFGLGIGLSMLSCIELIYWLTIRLCKNMKNRQVDTDLGPPELDVAIVSKPNTPSPPLPHIKPHFNNTPGVFFKKITHL